MHTVVRRLEVDDAPSLMALRREALIAEPLAFESSVADDFALVADSLTRLLADQHSQSVFGSFDGTALVGMVGLLKRPKLKLQHKAILWGMYVRAASRRGGVGGALLRAARMRATMGRGSRAAERQ